MRSLIDMMRLKTLVGPLAGVHTNLMIQSGKACICLGSIVRSRLLANKLRTQPCRAREDVARGIALGALPTFACARRYVHYSDAVGPTQPLVGAGCVNVIIWR